MCASAVFKPTDLLLFSMLPGTLQGPAARGAQGARRAFGASAQNSRLTLTVTLRPLPGKRLMLGLARSATTKVLT